MQNKDALQFYAVCPPGLERILASELRGMGISVPSNDETLQGSGGIEFSGTREDLYLANLHLRTASRIILRIGAFHAVKFVELIRKAANHAWEAYLLPGRPVSIRVTAHRSRLYHTGAVAERVVEAITERLGQKPPVEKYDEDSNINQLILIRMMDDECTISIDSSGAPLHHRGYRQALAKAPLRETLAAGILFASGWDRRAPLLDPFCGSGTIPIEAALLAANIPPGINRRFAFMDWAGFDAADWRKTLKTAKGQVIEHQTVIMGSDRDAGAIKMAVENAERAGVSALVQFSHRAISAIAPPDSAGWIVTNPPYGVRVSKRQDLRNLYDQFGNVLRQHCSGWHIAFLCSDDRLATHTRLDFQPGISLNNGGIPVKLNRGKVPD